MDRLNTCDSYIISRDGVPLGSVSNRIRVVDVTELAPSRSIKTVQRGGAVGSFVTRDSRASLAVRIQFAVLEDDYARRTEIMGRISAWAQSGSCLTIDDRPGQQLHCLCTALPASQSKRKWTGLCEMTFTAYAQPFWEDISVGGVWSPAATSHELTLTPQGTYPHTPLRGTLTAASIVDTVTLQAGGQQLTFSGLGMASGDQLHLTDQDGLLDAFLLSGAIRRSVLLLRTGESDDDLLLTARAANVITITADGAVTADMYARGRWE